MYKYLFNLFGRLEHSIITLSGEEYYILVADGTKKTIWWQGNVDHIWRKRIKWTTFLVYGIKSITLSSLLQMWYSFLHFHCPHVLGYAWFSVGRTSTYFRKIKLQKFHVWFLNGSEFCLNFTLKFRGRERIGFQNDTHSNLSLEILIQIFTKYKSIWSPLFESVFGSVWLISSVHSNSMS